MEDRHRERRRHDRLARRAIPRQRKEEEQRLDVLERRSPRGAIESAPGQSMPVKRSDAIVPVASVDSSRDGKQPLIELLLDSLQLLRLLL